MLETPKATSMKPIWEIVEKASTRLISVCTQATIAAYKAVNAAT